MKKVLLASLNAGGGHHALRDSFHQVLRTADPEGRRFQPVVWDSSDRFLNWFYSTVVHHMTALQGRIVDLSGRDWVIDIVSRASPALLIEAKRVLRENRYDAVISTHFMLSMMFAKAKHALGSDTKIVAAIPDYGIPTNSFRPQQAQLRADHTLVVGEDTFQHFVDDQHVPESQIHLSGFVTQEPFIRAGRILSATPRREDAKELILRSVAGELPQLAGLDPRRPTLLFLGGSAWTAKTGPVLERLFENLPLMQRLNLVVVCGKDQKFEAQIASRALAFPNVAVCGFVSATMLANLMALADASVLGSLAPATMQELLEVGAGPLLLHHFIPGTEQPHATYIERARVGAYEPNPEAMVALIEQVVGLAPATPRVAGFVKGFVERAREIRDESLTRAFQLPDFLETSVFKASRWQQRPSTEQFAVA